MIFQGIREIREIRGQTLKPQKESQKKRFFFVISHYSPSGSRISAKIWQGNVWQGNAEKNLQSYSSAHHSSATSGLSILHLRFDCGLPRCVPFAANKSCIWYSCQ